MPQVKIKQGSKSVVNNNAGVLNAGTLAVTTDTNELFFTHNDGTLHQLCDNVNKSGDTMTGNLNMSGNSFERAGFEVVTSLPTTNNFVGRQVTYQGRSYIWNGSAWKCDLKGNGTVNYLPKYIDVDILGNSGFYEEGGLLFGNIPLSPNLINNSWMNRVSSNGSPEGFIPATPMSGATLTTQAVDPRTKGFEGCYASAFDSGYMVSDAELATETNPMWYGQYYTGLRTTLGGLRNGWGSYGGGNIMKVSGSGFVKGTPFRYMGSFVTMKTDANQMGTKWIFSCWVKLVKGVTFAVGGDAGYYTTGPYPNSVSKTTADASPQGWYLHKVIVATSQISNISAQIMALAFEPDSNGEIEAYIALPYLAVSNTKGVGNHSWTNSVLDRLWDKGLQIDLINKNAYFQSSVQSNETINYDTSVEPTQTGTVTKTSTWIWQYLTQSVNYSWLKLKTWVGGLFSAGSATTNNNYLPKIDDVNKKLVKSNIYDDGTTPKYGANTIWHSGNDGSSSGLDADLLDGKHAGNTNGAIPINNGTLNTNLFAEKSNKNANMITITDFTTFNPTTLGLAIGESCNFTSTSAIGRPTFEVTTTCSGIIQMVYGTHYMIIAYSGANKLYPYDLQFALGGYVGSTFQGWQLYNSQGILDLLKKVDGTNSGLDADLLDGKHASDFITSVTKAMVENVLTGVITSHSHSGDDTKNTAGATNTSSKIYLVGSTDQTANPQTYTHDTAYVDVDGSVYSGSSKTITVSDLETNQIVTPTLNPTWTIKNYAGTVVNSPTNPSGEAITGTTIVLEYGFKPNMTVKGKWIAQAGYDNPTSCSGLCGTSLPASNIETAATSSIDLYNSTTYSSTTVPITTSAYWTISTPKKGITISGSSLVLPIGNISASARVQVTYQLPIYYGNVDNLTITEVVVKALTTKTWKNYQAISKSISPTINSSDSQYWIYAYPAAWGNLSTISNSDGDWTAAFTTNTVSITGAPGLAITYNYYITVNKGAFKNKTINFS